MSTRMKQIPFAVIQSLSFGVALFGLAASASMNATANAPTPDRADTALRGNRAKYRAKYELRMIRVCFIIARVSPSWRQISRLTPALPANHTLLQPCQLTS